MENFEINNNTVIKNISYDQGEILFNIMRLYNNGEPFECDMTASALKFYGKNKKSDYEIPLPKILMDVCPQREDIIKITPFQKLPLNDNSVQSVVFDPPFVISPKDSKSKIEKVEGSNLVSERFSSFYPVEELYYNYYWWIKDVYRVLKNDGIFVLKCMSTVSGGYQHNSEEWSLLCAMNAGFYCIDKFILEAKNRIVANSHFKNGQKHARKFTSVFYVFKKNDKMASKYNYLSMIEKMNTENLEGMVWDESKTKKRKRHNQITESEIKSEEKKETYYESIKRKVLEERRLKMQTNNTMTEKKHMNKKSYAIIQLACNGNYINEFANTDEVILKYPTISKSSISQCVNGKIKSSAGFIWIKKDNYNDEYVNERVRICLRKQSKLA